MTMGELQEAGRQRGFGIDAWFATEESAKRYCNLHKDCTFQKSKTGSGYIVIRHR